MKKKMSTWKLAVLIPVVAGFFFVVACQDQVISEITEVAQNSTMATDYPKEVQDQLDKLKAKDPNGNYKVIEMNEEGAAKFNNMSAHSVSLVEIKELDGNKRMFAIVDFDENAKKVADLSKNGEEVFTIVEETATYPGGLEEFSKFVYDNIQYPAQARQMGVEGKVHVQIIIEKDGSVTGVTPMKGIGAGCDAEAVRVLSLSKPWNPAKQRGKAVRQKLVVPIIFKLNDESLKTVSVEPLNNKLMVEIINEKHSGGTVVKGMVKDEEGNPLPGTNIILEGTTLGTVSDLDGAFTLKMKESNGKIHVSFVGFESTVIAF